MREYDTRLLTPAGSFFIFIVFIGVGLVIGGLAGAGIWVAMTGQSITHFEKDLINPAYTNAARVVQVISVFFMFFLPAFVIARINDYRPFKWLGFREGFNGKQVILAIAIMLSALPVVGALAELNQAIPLPKWVEAIVKKMEENYTQQSEAMALMRSFPDYIFSLFVVALIPALVEEVCFRGGLQRILIEWFKKPMVAVVIASIIFSAMHISYYGFLPRVALGLVLGLIYYYSGSLWLSIIAHFANNALLITLMYVASLNHKSVKDAAAANAPIWTALPALIVVVALVVYFRQISFERKISKIPPMDAPSVDSSLV